MCWQGKDGGNGTGTLRNSNEKKTPQKRGGPSEW